MVKYFFAHIVLFLFLQVGARAEEIRKGASRQEIYDSIQNMLEYHVEYKDFSSLIAKRSFKLFINQFDPYKMYFLKGEVKSFLRMSQEKLEEVVQNHHDQTYGFYEDLHDLVRASIQRSKEIRSILRPQLLKEDLIEASQSFETFGEDFEELKGRIHHKLRSFLLSEKKLEAVDDFSEKERARLLGLWEDRMSKIEAPYLESSFNSSFFSMRVLKSIAKSLDAHTTFFSEEEAYDLKTTLEKQFEGIGIVLREGVQGIAIKSLIKNGPAEKTGKIQKGDLLISVDGQSVDSLSYEEVLSRLKGERGQKVSLKLNRYQASQEEVIEVDVLREKVIMEDERVHFSTTPFGSGVIGNIVVPSFYESKDGASCAGDLKEAIAQIRSQGPLLGLVLDMRENSGGFLSQAVKVASLFMSGGVVVVSKYSEGQMQYLRNTDGKIFYQGPLVILTSKASASATEIVAQALQDYGIAVIVGDRRTYGKGTIQYQTVTSKNSSSYFKVTVGKYYTVSGRSTQIEGVHADIQVPTSYASLNIGEKYLAYPLKNDQIESVFNDPLNDVSARSKSWMKKNYLPQVQKKLSFWTEVLPLLKSNSEYRLKNDKDFVQFLEWINSESVSVLASEDVLDGVDLQSNEAIQIAKDMVILEGKQEK